jgi:hypothetical protein
MEEEEESVEMAGSWRGTALTGRCVLERGHGAGVGTAVDGYRAWHLIERRDTSSSGSSAGVGERERHCAGL